MTKFCSFIPSSRKTNDQYQKQKKENDLMYEHLTQQP